MKYSIFGYAVLLLFSLWPALVQAEWREWSSSDGKFKIKAELVGFDGNLVKLKKADGTEIKVPPARLSAVDLQYLESKKKEFPPTEELKANLPAAVLRFQKSIQSMRYAEASRLQKRIDLLQSELEKAKKAKPAAPKVNAGTAPPFLKARMKNAINAVEIALRKEAAAKEKANEREVAALIKTLGQRLELVKSGEPFLPRLSPRDFAVGQIGEFDDDFVLSTSGPGKDGVRISVLFEEWKCLPEFIRGETVPLSRGLVSRPDSFYVRSDILSPLVDVERVGDRDCPTNRLLHKHFFEIVDKIPEGAGSGYVLVPFQMDEVLAWLKVEEAKRPKK